MASKSRTKRAAEKAADKSIFIGSGNVYKDLGLPDADEMLAKAELAYRICILIDKRGVNQTQAAKVLGADRARVSNLMRGQLKEFSMERLFQFLNKLGQDVDVTVRPKRGRLASVHIKAA